MSAYADTLIARFANAALNHRLIQIGIDGSQKTPQRWLQTLDFHQQAGPQYPVIVKALAAWIMHVRGDAHVVDDPMRDILRESWQIAGRKGIARALFGPGGIFAHIWEGDDGDLTMITTLLR
jgi:fructuronate reductase